MKVMKSIIVLSVISSATKFRSKAGCCICGTKSQQGKPFLTSDKYKTKFPAVFCICEIDSDLCNACCYAVREWKDGDRRKSEVSTLHGPRARRLGLKLRHLALICS